MLAPGGTLCLSATNRHSRLLATAKLWSWPVRLRGGRYAAYDPAALAGELRRAGFLLEEQIFYGHFLAAGRFACGARRRLEEWNARRRPAPATPGPASSSSSPAAPLDQQEAVFFDSRPFRNHPQRGVVPFPSDVTSERETPSCLNTRQPGSRTWS